MVKFFMVTAMGLMLVACSNVSSRVGSKVDAVVVGLTQVERLALIYTSLPRCGRAVIVCSDPIIVAKIKDLDNKAYLAVKAAEANEALLSLAISAVGNLQAAVPVK